MKTINEEIAAIMELNEKRTQGEWVFEHDGDEGSVTVWAGSAIEGRHTGMYDSVGEMNLYDCVYDEEEAENGEFLANAQLIASAPAMVSIIQRLQAQLAERDKLLGECEEVLSRFDVSVLTHISRSMYSDLMYKLITKPTEE